MAESSEAVEQDSAPPKWRSGLLLFVVAPAVIAGCVTAPFIGYDDHIHVANELMSPELPFWEAFRFVIPHPINPRLAPGGPLTLLTYRIDRWLFQGFEGGWAPGVRINSLLLHVLAGLILWRIFLRFRAGTMASLLAATAWVVHPMACESVAWASERKNVLAAFFGFSAVWCYCGETRRTWRLLAAAALYALAIMSKPPAAGFVAIFVAYELALRKPEATIAATLRSRLSSLIALGAMVAFTLWIARVNVQFAGGSLSTYAGGSLFTVLLTDVVVLAQYLRQALLPDRLSIFYYVKPVVSVIDPWLWISGAAVLAAVGGSVWLAENRRLIVFLWLWFFGALVPALNLFPLPYLMQDRYLYYSLPSLLLITVLTLSAACRRFGVKLSPGVVKLCVAVPLAGLMAMTLARSRVFADDVALFQDAVEAQPDSAFARSFLGTSLCEHANLLHDSRWNDKQQEMAKKALEQLLAALAAPDAERLLAPGQIKIVAGVLQWRLGDAVAGRKLVVEALSGPLTNQNRSAGLVYLARIDMQSGNAVKASEWIDRALALHAEQERPHEALLLAGECLELQRQFQEAARFYRAIPANSPLANAAAERLKALPAQVSPER